MARSRFQMIGEDDAVAEAEAQQTVAAIAPSRPSRLDNALTGMLTMALTALSKRFVIALAALGDILMIGSVFVLWYRVIDMPSILQLVGLGLYAIFIASLVVCRRRQ